MKVFVTGATGFIGSAIVRELAAAGHQVVGLARSDRAAAALAAMGVEAQRGSLDDLDSLHRGAANADGVIHTAFINISATVNLADSSAIDRRAIETLGEALVGSNRPLVVTAGIAGLAPGRLLTEEDPTPASLVRLSEQTGMQFTQRGVRLSVVRLPPSVHGEGDHGFVPALIEMARVSRVSAYPGDGAQRWCAVHRLDAARLYRLALEHAPAGTRLHAVADEGVPARDLAGVIGRRLALPVVSLSAEKASEHFGWLARIFSMDSPASAARTQQQFGWQPLQPGLLADLDHAYYFH